ncbi:hypothetical protein SAMN02745157_0168 [Kaistia soli DSM 19436]|uniref:Uncharacterized protein n=1 Tax=Kaistia soli DSM 19436 TaxID=1122133 RepID=A0A1M5PH87_9HYPH|nr:hypothetical protein SAMN02745157_0168 [Kaistia soli DSM 19436]
METAFGDIVIRLTEAALTADQLSADAITVLCAEAARTIQDLRDEIEELRTARSDVAAADHGRRSANPQDGADCR